MRTKKVLLGCLLGLIVVATPRGASPSEERARRRQSSNRCSAILVSSPDYNGTTTTGTGRRLPTFSASEILDLKLSVLVPAAAPGDSKVQMKLYTPNGHLYQSFNASASPSSPPRKDRRGKRVRTLSATLPVAGTTIVNSSLYGEWRIEAFLDGERDTPCVRPQRFVIEP